MSTEVARALEVAADPRELERLATFAAVAAREVGFSEQVSRRVELAVDEACSNVIEHAYAGKPGTIRLSVNIIPQHELIVTVIDHGKPFDPSVINEYVPVTSMAEVKVGGLGLYLMKKVMDSVRFEFDIPGVGNRLTMTKRI